MQPVNLAISGLQHVGIPVTDLKTSTDFYEKLGFVKVMESAFDFNQGKGNCVMMGSGKIIIELYQLPDGELSAIRKRTDGHIDHIAFDVPDIDVAFLTLKRAGYRLLEESPTFLHFWENGCRFFNLVGPDGERLEFNQIL